jgi:purine nucleosidase
VDDQFRIILDVDTGIDDALAILYALGRPKITLDALTTTYGNIDVEIATRNSLQLLELAGRPDVPVARGVSRPLTQPFNGGAPHVHGKNGFGGVDMAPPKGRAVDTWGPDLLIEMARQYPGEITLLAVSPMTNVAQALMKAPDIATKFRKIVMMGSTLNHPGIGGVVPPMVDANFHNDPEAARIVLQSGANLVAVGMDVTMHAKLRATDINAIEARGGPAARAAMQASRFYLAAYESFYPGTDYCGLHDPLAVALAELPNLGTYETMSADIECTGVLTRGQMIADRRPTAPDSNLLDVTVSVDFDRFSTLFAEAVAAQ